MNKVSIIFLSALHLFSISYSMTPVRIDPEVRLEQLTVSVSWLQDRLTGGIYDQKKEHDQLSGDIDHIGDTAKQLSLEYKKQNKRVETALLNELSMTMTGLKDVIKNLSNEDCSKIFDLRFISSRIGQASGLLRAIQINRHAIEPNQSAKL